MGPSMYLSLPFLVSANQGMGSIVRQLLSVFLASVGCRWICVGVSKSAEEAHDGILFQAVSNRVEKWPMATHGYVSTIRLPGTFLVNDPWQTCISLTSQWVSVCHCFPTRHKTVPHTPPAIKDIGLWKSSGSLGRKPVPGWIK